MFAEKIAGIILSKKQYKIIKNKYRRLLYFIHPKLSESEFRQILTNNLGIGKGSVVFIHSSIDKLFINFNPEKVLDILIEIVGSEGTILLPCTQLQERADVYLQRGEIFNVKKTLPKMGLLPGLAMFHKNSVRSLHPTNSVVAIGKLANELTKEHPDSIYPCGDKSPYYKIIAYNGIIIGLGVTIETLTFVHTIEDVMKDKFPVQTRRKEIFYAKVLDWKGDERVIPTLVQHPNTGYRQITQYMKKHIPQNIYFDFKFKNVKFFKADAKLLFEKMTDLASKNITIYSKIVNITKD